MFGRGGRGKKERGKGEKVLYSSDSAPPIVRAELGKRINEKRKKG